MILVRSAEADDSTETRRQRDVVDCHLNFAPAIADSRQRLQPEATAKKEPNQENDRCALQ